MEIQNKKTLQEFLRKDSGTDSVRIVNPMLEPENPFIDDDEDEGYSIFPVVKPKQGLNAVETVEGSEPGRETVETVEDTGSELGVTSVVEPVRAGTKSTSKLKGRKRYKRDITQKDIEVLLFLSISRIATNRQIAHATLVSEAAIKKRLYALKTVNLIKSIEITGRRLVYFLAPAGWRVLEEQYLVEPEDVVHIKGSEISYAVVGHSLGMSQVLAQLCAGRIHPLGGKVARVVPVPINMDLLVPDFRMRSAWEAHRLNVTNQIGKDASPEARAKALLKGAPKDSLVLPARNWKYASNIDGYQTHRPDMAILIPGHTIAVEVELTAKKKKDYWNIFDRFKDNPDTYQRLVWVVNNKNVGVRIANAWKSWKEESDNKFVKIEFNLVHMKDFEGEDFTESAWKL